MLSVCMVSVCMVSVCMVSVCVSMYSTQAHVAVGDHDLYSWDFSELIGSQQCQCSLLIKQR